MVEVSLFKKEDGYTGFVVRGHADYAKKGRDIVCAAISILSYTTYRSFHEVLKCEVDVCMKDGNMELHLKKEPDDSTELLFSFFLEGIKSLVDEYENYVKYEIKEDIC